MIPPIDQASTGRRALALDIDAVGFTYENADTPALRAVTLQIEQGECVVVTGRSGCGKTTLTRLMNGLIPVVYKGESAGLVAIMGKRVESWTMESLSSTVGSVFQNPRSQFVNLDVTSEVAFGCENQGIAREDIIRRVDGAVAALGVAHLLGRDVEALSGGQKQSVILASAYAVHPEVFVLDEPTASLDVASMHRLAQTVAALKAQGKTVIVSEHRLWWLSGIADRVVHMDGGSIVGDWSAQEFAAIPLEQRSAWGLRAWTIDEVDEQLAQSGIDPRPLGHAQAEGGAQPGDSAACLGSSQPHIRGDAVVSVRDVSVGYRRAPGILHDLDFELCAGRVIGLVGRNGAGKTTLARCMTGLMREKRGSVSVRGAPLTARKRAGKAYLVMQEPGYQLFSNTVDGELEDSLDRSQADVADPQTVAETMKAQMALDHLSQRHPLSLSGGERQRLSLAAGLLCCAEAIVMDEPTSGLDYGNMMRIVDQVERLRIQGVGICIISHDYEFLCSACDDIAVVDGGRIAETFPLNRETLPKLKERFGFTSSAEEALARVDT